MSPQLGARLGATAVRGEELVDLDLVAPEGRAVTVRLVRELRAPGGGRLFDRETVSTWRCGTRREQALRLPRVPPSWQGQSVEIAYLLELEEEGASGPPVALPVALLPGEAPAEGADRPTPEQARWLATQGQRLRAGNCIGGVVEIILTLAAFGGIGQLFGRLLTGHAVTFQAVFVALASLGWLVVMVINTLRRLADKKTHLGLVEPPAAALGGSFRGRAFRPLRWQLVLQEHSSYAVGMDGQTRPRTLDRTILADDAPAGPFEVPVPADLPASIGALHGGVSWWLLLSAGKGVQRIPLVVLPWLAP